jgi:type IV pilus assembly protein PilQ
MKTCKLYAILILLLLTVPVRGNQKLTSQTLSMELEGVPLVSVLNMIASQKELNLVISDEVSGEVTMRLVDVDVATALDALLTANGYNYFIKEDVIVVKSADADALGELASRMITLRYLDPITAKKALDSRKSTRGSIIILDRQAGSEGGSEDEDYKPNRILVTDFPNILDELVALADELDVPERVILIEARIIETTIDSETNLGFSWPTALTTRLSDAGGTGSSTSTTTVADGQRRAGGVYDPSNGRWRWGKLSVDEVELVLHLLELSGNSKLISDPRITTLENHEAEFKFETIIPIQTINRFTEGAATSDIVTFEDEEVGISLKVTPRINEGSRITLDIQPKVEDIIGFNGPPDNQKPITASRSIKTRITVTDGETVALGGLLKENEIERVQKVPLLGHIPLIGSLLFTRKSTEKTASDLIILITPHILD